jgi:putative FmdB family regulatory protein
LPIYSYQCQACQNVLEKRQSFSDDPLTICEACGGTLRKLLHPVGIVFKGSGFYNTDYKGNGSATKPDPAKSESSETATPSTSSTNGSDSSATKSDSSSSTSSPSTDAAATSAKAS